jgi:hypothetical protein
MNQEGEESVAKRMFMDLYQKARDDAFSPSNIQGAWRGAGLVPLDPSRAVECALP